MLEFQGKSVYKGIAAGRIRVLGKEERKISFCYAPDIAAETMRLEQALQAAGEQLEEIYLRALVQVGEKEASIFRMHKLILQDEMYITAVKELIREENANAEYAVAAVADKFATMFEQMPDDSMQSRAADVRAVSDQLLACLLSEEGKQGRMAPPGIGWKSEGETNEEDVIYDIEPVIILAEDLTPGQTVQLDKKSVLAFVTVRGSVNSHAAILARTMNIPTLVGTQISYGLEVPDLEVLNGRLAVVDGYYGSFYVDPDESYLQEVRQKMFADREQKEKLEAFKGKETVTADGRKIELYANIGSVEDVADALENDAEGIGLFRSECLYLGRDTYPGEDEQQSAYRAVAEAMKGKRVVIRTLDIGADKQAEYFGLTPERNPAMGFRAIRICLTRPEMLKIQLRAILRAAVHGNVAVLYPMITSVWEVRRLRELLAEAQAELEAEGIPYGPVEQGVMVETPAAALISDLLAPLVDFFSIGTNDLTQYTLAIDRENGELDDFYDGNHPAVHRLIRLAAQNARQAGIRCCICGEAAADPGMTEAFLEWGIDELSVAAGSILPLRKQIREYRK